LAQPDEPADLALNPLIPTAPSPDSYAGGPGACVLLDSLCS
jgi:hypothetical protein